jgi:hypothetical protein
MRVQLVLITENEQLYTFTDDMQGGADTLSLGGVAGLSVYATVQRGPDYQVGDHVRLMEANRVTGTDTICLDPAISAGPRIQLADIDKGFANRATAADFITKDNPGDSYARVRLYNEDDPTTTPSMVFYSFQQPPGPGGFIDLDEYFFNGKTFKLLLESLTTPEKGELEVYADAGPVPLPSTQQALIELSNPQPDLHVLGMQSNIRLLRFSPAQPEPL